MITKIPLWSAKWSKEALQKKYAENPLVFNRGFRQSVINREDCQFPSFAKCIHPIGTYNPDEIIFVCTGVDLSGDKRSGNALFTLGVDRKGRRIPIDIRMGHWSSPDTAKQIELVNIQFNPRVIMIENNAYQQSIIDWAKQSNYNYWQKVQPFTTTSAKNKMETGLPSLEVEFMNESWAIYAEHINNHQPGCNCAWHLWMNEVQGYPFFKTTDLLMASWFARECVVQYVSLGKREMVLNEGRRDTAPDEQIFNDNRRTGGGDW